MIKIYTRPKKVGSITTTQENISKLQETIIDSISTSNANFSNKIRVPIKKIQLHHNFIKYAEQSKRLSQAQQCGFFYLKCFCKSIFLILIYFQITISLEMVLNISALPVVGTKMDPLITIL